MIVIGTMMIPETGIEAFELACQKSINNYNVERSITGYFRLYSDGFLVHDDPSCDDVHDENKAYYFFAQLISEKENNK